MSPIVAGPAIDRPPSGVVLKTSAVLSLVSTPRVRALTPLLASTLRWRRLHTLLLLLVVTLGAGGSGLGARTTEIAEAESESQVRLEATHARRRAVHLEHVPQGVVGELEESNVDPQGSPCRARRDPSDPKSPEYQFLGPPRPSRAPPPSA